MRRPAITTLAAALAVATLTSCEPDSGGSDAAAGTPPVRALPRNVCPDLPNATLPKTNNVVEIMVWLSKVDPRKRCPQVIEQKTTVTVDGTTSEASSVVYNDPTTKTTYSHESDGSRGIKIGSRLWGCRGDDAYIPMSQTHLVGYWEPADKEALGALKTLEQMGTDTPFGSARKVLEMAYGKSTTFRSRRGETIDGVQTTHLRAVGTAPGLFSDEDGETDTGNSTLKTTFTLDLWVDRKGGIRRQVKDDRTIKIGTETASPPDTARLELNVKSFGIGMPRPKLPPGFNGSTQPSDPTDPSLKCHGWTFGVRPLTGGEVKNPGYRTG